MNEILKKVQLKIDNDKETGKNVQKAHRNKTLLDRLYEVTGERFTLSSDNLVKIDDREFSIQEWSSRDSFSYSRMLTCTWPSKQKKYVFFGKPVIRTVYREIFDAEDFLGVFED